MKLHGILFLILTTLVLGACGGGGGGDTPPVNPPQPPSNQQPTISGIPAVSVMVGEAYSFTPAASDLDGDSLTFSIGNRPGWASFDSGTGSLTGAPALGDVGTYDAVAISVSDGTATTTLQSFAITVVGNRPPVISGAPAGSVMVGEAYSFTPAAGDLDGDSLTFSIGNRPGWASFDTGTGALIGTPLLGDVGIYDAIDISVSDGTATATLQSFAITVIGNRPPLIAGTPAQSVMAGEAYVFIPTAIDNDGDSLLFSIVNLPGWADFDTGTGALTGTPTPGDVGTYGAITITVSDGMATAALQPFAISVTGNQPPEISGSPSLTAMAGSPYAFTPTASDGDGDSLSFSIVNQPGWADFDTGTGALTGTPAPGDVGTSGAITITVSDGTATATLQSFAIAVIGNRPPLIAGTPAQSVMAGEAYVFIPTAIDNDGDSLLFSIVNLPGWADFDTGTGALTGTPTPGDVGTYGAITITVSDGMATAALQPFAISVTGNQPPEISGSPSLTAMAGSPYAFTPTASDGDGDSLSFSIVNQPGWADFDTGTGALTGTPAPGDVGTYGAITITVSDGMATAALQPFAINVTDNQPPEISGSPNLTAMVGSSYAFTPTASDGDGDSLVFSVTNLPSWASFDTDSGALTGTPMAADIGTYTDIVITVTDGMAIAELDAFAITVTDSATGAVLLEWTPPLLDGDDTVLGDLAGFKVRYGTASGNYPDVIDVPSAGVSSYLVENLAPATYFFVVTAIDTVGNESDFSNEVSRVVP